MLTDISDSQIGFEDLLGFALLGISMVDHFPEGVINSETLNDILLYKFSSVVNSCGINDDDH